MSAKTKFALMAEKARKAQLANQTGSKKPDVTKTTTTSASPNKTNSDSGRFRRKVTLGKASATTNKPVTQAKEVVVVDKAFDYNFVGGVAAYLRNGGLTPIESFLVGTSLWETRDTWMGDTSYEEVVMEVEDYVSQTDLHVDEVVFIGSEALEGMDIYSILESGLFKQEKDEEGQPYGDPVPSKAILGILADSKRLTQKAWVDREADYGVGEDNISAMMKSAIEAQEAVMFRKNPLAYELGKHIMENSPKDSPLRSDAYAMLAIGDLDEPVCLERKVDVGGRIYQVLYHGLQPNESDLMRSVAEFAEVSLDYDPDTAKRLYWDQLEGLKKGCTLEDAIYAVEDPECFYHNGGASKPLLFVRYAQDYIALLEFMENGGEKPSLNMPVGIDATCSGLQLAGLTLGDLAVLKMTGVSLTQYQDAYTTAVGKLEKLGFKGLGRALVKAPFIAILYGQGWNAYACSEEEAESCKEEYMNLELWDIIHNTGEMDEARAILFHRTIVDVFGTKVKNLRRLMSDNFGNRWDAEEGGFVPRIHSPIAFEMQDGYVVAKQHFKMVNILGEHGEGLDFRIHSPESEYGFKKAKFATKEYELTSYGYKGFVTLIHALDALVARCVTVKMAKKGVRNALTNHDCFKTDVCNIHHLIDAIKETYLELFTGNDPCPDTGEDWVGGLDLIANYFDSAYEVLLPEEQVKYQAGHKKGQFWFNARTDEWERRATTNLAKKGFYVEKALNGLTVDNTGSQYFKP